MRKWIYLLFAIGCVHLSIVGQEQGEALSASDFKEMEEALLANAKQLKTIQSDFVQVKNMSFLKAEIRSSGLFFFKSPHFLRWQYVNPYNYIVVIDDKQIAIDDEGRKSVFDVASNEGFKTLNEILVATVNGDFFSSGQFHVKAYYGEAGMRLLKLEPKDEGVKSKVNAMEIVVKEEDWSVQEVKMMEPSGDYTLITFKKQRFNSELEKGLFTIDN